MKGDPMSKSACIYQCPECERVFVLSVEDALSKGPPTCCNAGVRLGLLVDLESFICEMCNVPAMRDSIKENIVHHLTKQEG